jgi:GH24 family phage-related lysozyme (muramidase)
MQTQSLNAMREQQLMGAEKENMDLRREMANPNFDINAPDAAARILRVAPRSGAQTYQALMAAQRERRQAEGAGLENATKLTLAFRNMLPTATPENYPAIRAAALAAVPSWAPSWPETYNADAVRRLMEKADDSLLRYRTTVTASPAGGFVSAPQAMPYGTEPLQGPTFIPAENIPAAPTPAAPGAPAPRAEAPSLGDPGRDMAAAMLRRSEGFRAEPYFDRTAFRTGYGSDQITTADGRVVPVTQGTRVTQEDAERDLARRVPEFERRAAAAVGEERFAALPPNVRAALISVAYNYGTLPGRIRNAVQSGDVDAIAAAVEGLAGDNQGVNARRRSEEAAVIRGANAMAPGAAPANAMLAPDAAPAGSEMPILPNFGVPRNLAEAQRAQALQAAVLELEKKRIEAERRRGEQPERVQEAGQTAGAVAGAQANVRRAEQPARVEEAGQTVSAQEAARIQVREAETRRAETEKLNTAINELERISRPGGLLERSTGSGVGRLVDIVGEFIGLSSRGAQAAAALAPIADIVLKMVPRFEGPQSDKDSATYQAAAGRLADPTIPNETRLAAAREIVRLMRARRDQFSYAAGGAAAPTAAPAAPTAPTAPPVPAGVDMTQDNWSRLWSVMTPQERALWPN